MVQPLEPPTSFGTIRLQTQTQSIATGCQLQSEAELPVEIICEIFEKFIEDDSQPNDDDPPRPRIYPAFGRVFLNGRESKNTTASSILCPHV
jgi:hypothetical protein